MIYFDFSNTLKIQTPSSALWTFLDLVRQSVPTSWSTAVDIATLTPRSTGDVAKPSDGEAKGQLGGL